MHFLHRILSRHYPLRPHIRTLYDDAISLSRPRDRGLDHAVAREAHLKPLLNIKNLIISQPSKTIPYSQIIESKQSLQIPFRPLDLIRSYPSVFQEIYPGTVITQPDIKLTNDVVSLSLEEDLIYQSFNYKKEVAERLLKLLMISRVCKIPVSLLDILKWELGLPNDYENVIIPEFPDYFRVVSGKSGSKELELVFWSDEFAVSELEKKGEKEGGVRFSLHYSTGFEMDKEYRKWLDEWVELPYVSPYENATRLPVKSDESDRWAVGVLHEVLNLFVGRKAERESLMHLGDFLGIRSRFKLAFLHHPGIFYTSTKIGTQTVVLRDAYKRGAMVKRHALMDLRFKYVHLMNTMVEEEKPKDMQEKSSVEEEEKEKGGVEDYEDSESGEESNVEMCESTDDEDDSEEEEESETESQRGRRKRGHDNFEDNNSRRNVERGSSGRYTRKNEYESSERVSRRPDVRSDEYGPSKGRHDNFEEKDYRRRMERGSHGRSTIKNEYESSERVSRRPDVRSDGYGPSKGRRDNFEEKDSRRRMERGSYGRSTIKNEYESSQGFSRRSSDDSDGFVPRRSRQRTDGYEEGEGKGGSKKREFKREVNFDDKNVRRSSPRKSYGIDNLSNENERFSRRINVRDYVKKQGNV